VSAFDRERGHRLRRFLQQRGDADGAQVRGFQAVL